MSATILNFTPRRTPASFAENIWVDWTLLCVTAGLVVVVMISYYWRR